MLPDPLTFPAFQIFIHSRARFFLLQTDWVFWLGNTGKLLHAARRQSSDGPQSLNWTRIQKAQSNILLRVSTSSAAQESLRPWPTAHGSRTVPAESTEQLPLSVGCHACKLHSYFDHAKAGPMLAQDRYRNNWPLSRVNMIFVYSHTWRETCNCEVIGEDLKCFPNTSILQLKCWASWVRSKVT